MFGLVPLLLILYLGVGSMYFLECFPDIYTEYGLWQYDGIKEGVVISFFIIFWLPYLIISTVIGWTIDATYNMIKWFILSGQVDKDGFEKEDFE